MGCKGDCISSHGAALVGVSAKVRVDIGWADARHEVRADHRLDEEREDNSECELARRRRRSKGEERGAADSLKSHRKKEERTREARSKT